MNWKIIFGWSLFGLAMGVGPAFGLAFRTEVILWLMIVVICAFVIARQAPSRTFLHGFLLGVVSGIWFTGAHIVFFDRYAAGNSYEARMMRALDATAGALPRVVMSASGLANGAILGIVLGVLAYLAAKILSRSNPVGES